MSTREYRVDFYRDFAAFEIPSCCSLLPQRLRYSVGFSLTLMKGDEQIRTVRLKFAQLGGSGLFEQVSQWSKIKIQVRGRQAKLRGEFVDLGFKFHQS